VKLSKIVLILLLVAVSSTAGAQTLAQAGDNVSPRVINISAKRYSFAPNQIILKKGEAVTLRLTSEDRIHGFYLKPLKIDEVIEPGKTTEVTITPTQTGTFTIICDHFCGAGHGNMNLTVIVE
jgi:cytochrome c oxidase subunit 2